MFTDLTLSDINLGYHDRTATEPFHGNMLQVLWDDGTSSGELLVAHEGERIEVFEFADGTTVSAIGVDSANRIVLTGTSGDDVIRGGGGRDYIKGGAGNDTLSAGTGGEVHHQYLFGEAGDDTYLYAKENGRVMLDGGSETAAGGTDRVVFTDLTLSDINLGYYDRTATEPFHGNMLQVLWNDGTSSGELLVAHEGQHIEVFEFADGTTVSAISVDAASRITLTGTSGDDFVRGSAGEDILAGANGNDTLNGGLGSDELAGGVGDDVFVFGDAGDDRIVDFVAGAGTDDRIDVSGLGLTTLNDALAGAYEDAGDTVLDLGAGISVRLVGTQLAGLHQDDFLFAA